jgi:phosphinothricin acetyltransferase
MSEQALSPVRVVGPVTIVPAKPGDVLAILDLMHIVNLPRDGVAEALEHFWVARQDGQVVGTVGIEVYGDCALLRSLAVTPAWQGQALGLALTDTALSYLMSRQFQAVYLLTTTAEQFFRRHDFLVVPRTAVPSSVQHSVEFQSACPDTATCMVRMFTYPAAMPTAELLLRAARFADVPMIRTIRNQGILERVATLDAEPHTAPETLLWFSNHGPRHPVLVAEMTGGIVGWASLNPFNPRKAYQYVADLSVYIERQQRGKGIGGKLLQAIIALGRELEYHKIVLSAFPSNTAGIRLYERHGFTTVGIYKEMGQLDGRWVDTVVMEKLLNSPPST